MAQDIFTHNPYQVPQAGIYQPNLTEAMAQKSFVNTSAPYTVSAPVKPTGGTMVVNEAPTTLSNQTVNDKVNENIVKLNELTENKGITVGEDGSQRYADGSFVPQGFAWTNPNEAYLQYANSGGTLGMNEWADAGRPTGTGTGETSLTTADTSAEDDATQALLDNMKAVSDAQTASMIANIQQQFEQRRIEQRDINTRQLAGTQNALLMGGVTGQGSSAQYAPISSGSIISAQESYGIKQLASLDSEEQNLIAQARAAQTENDFKLMDKKLALIEEKRKEKVALAQKLNDDIIEQNKKIREQNYQSSRDNAVADLYSQGITNPSEMLNYLNFDEQGNKIGDFTLKEVNEAIKNINPDSSQIRLLAAEIAKKGADVATIQKVLTSPDYDTALQNSGDWLSQMNPTEKLDYQIKLADLAYKQKQTALLGEPTAASKAAEAAKLQTEQGQIEVLQDKADAIEVLKTGIGMENRVGPNFLTRGQTTWTGGLGKLLSIVGIPSLLKNRVAEFTGAGQAFAGGIHQLTSQEFLDALIAAKAAGATFGALTDREGDALRAAATKINDWEIKDDKGKGLGVWNVSQSEFIKELNRIQDLANKAVERAEENVVTSDEQAVLDEIYGTEDDSSNYYSE